jgi:hypothetical protein
LGVANALAARFPGLGSLGAMGLKGTGVLGGAIGGSALGGSDEDAADYNQNWSVISGLFTILGPVGVALGGLSEAANNTTQTLGILANEILNRDDTSQLDADVAEARLRLAREEYNESMRLKQEEHRMEMENIAIEANAKSIDKALEMQAGAGNFQDVGRGGNIQLLGESKDDKNLQDIIATVAARSSKTTNVVADSLKNSSESVNNGLRQLGSTQRDANDHLVKQLSIMTQDYERLRSRVDQLRSK